MEMFMIFTIVCKAFCDVQYSLQRLSVQWNLSIKDLHIGKPLY